MSTTQAAPQPTRAQAFARRVHASMMATANYLEALTESVAPKHEGDRVITITREQFRSLIEPALVALEPALDAMESVIR